MLPSKGWNAENIDNYLENDRAEPDSYQAVADFYRDN